MAFPASAPTRSAAPCTPPASAGRRGGAGARPAWSCASASTTASSPSPTRMPRQKGADRAGLHARCRPRPGGLVRGRGRALPGRAATRPHEYVRGGTCKLLTLFHPATGHVHLQPAGSSTNPVLHGWLKERLATIVATLPAPADAAATRGAWEAWQ